MNTLNTASLKRILLPLLIVAIVAGFWWVWENVTENRSENVNQAQTFVNNDTNESISVLFDSAGSANLTGKGYSNLVFSQVVSASGELYINEVEGLELWKRGDEITLSQGDNQIFVGSASSTVNNRRPNHNQFLPVEPDRPSIPPDRVF
jgi:membrane-bound inhibitor of C-type lysozyme